MIRQPRHPALVRHWFLALLLAAGPLSGCAFVKLSAAGEEVDVRANSAVIDCDKLGAVTVNGLDKVGFIQRKDRSVSSELLTQARNDAAEMGANVVVPIGHPVEGRQKFATYRCP